MGRLVIPYTASLVVQTLSWSPTSRRMPNTGRARETGCRPRGGADGTASDTAVTGELAPDQDHAGAMRDRTDERSSRPGGGRRPAQDLPVESCRRQQPLWRCSSARCRARRSSRSTGRGADHVSREAAGRQIEGIAVEIAKHTAETTFGGTR
jgi:hypothetical protein